ncbi:hypothetical protein [Nonomuraea monospora]|uniref:hypothetical protein n=1 Tax=Nonomuraea monospora TaxID=568818 RepID=UPI0031D408EF
MVNVLTDSWSWQIFALTAALLAVVAAIAFRTEGKRSRERAAGSGPTQLAVGRGARIASSPVKTTGADVEQVAGNRGQIVNSGITAAENTTVRQRASNGGLIEDSPITAL